MRASVLGRPTCPNGATVAEAERYQPAAPPRRSASHHQPDREHERLAPPRRAQRQAREGRGHDPPLVDHGIAQAQKGFRRVKGYVHMASLVAALRAAAATVASEKKLA